MERVGTLLRDARRAGDLTQAEFALRLGISQPAISALERDDSNPTVRTLERAFAALGYELELRPTRRATNVDLTLIRRHLRQPMGERIRALDRMRSDAHALSRAIKRR